MQAKKPLHRSGNVLRMVDLFSTKYIKNKTRLLDENNDNQETLDKIQQLLCKV